MRLSTIFLLTIFCTIIDETISRRIYRLTLLNNSNLFIKLVLELLFAQTIIDF